MRIPRISVVALLAAVMLAAPGLSPAPLAQQVAASLSAVPSSPGVAAPFSSSAEALEFLRTAEVVSIEAIPVGVTEPRKVLLELDGVRANAVFRDVEMSKERVRLNDGSFHMRLRDSALFEVAAYRLSVLLGIDNVPPAVLRNIEGAAGSLQLWVEDAMSETHRRKNNLPLLDRDRWLEQMRLMTLFDTLVGNIDRNGGNYLHDASGKMWFIDHTRAFQMFPGDWSPRKIAFCARDLWQRLQALDGAVLKGALGDVLQRGEINQLAHRLDQIVAHIREQIAARGEREVIL